jgi:hypothetical protein
MRKKWFVRLGMAARGIASSSRASVLGWVLIDMIPGRNCFGHSKKQPRNWNLCSSSSCTFNVLDSEARAYGLTDSPVGMLAWIIAPIHMRVRCEEKEETRNRFFVLFRFAEQSVSP